MLELKNLSYCVRNEDGTDLTILNNISLTIEDNKLVVFTGPNGGGKTTLARAIMGLIRPTSGQIFTTAGTSRIWASPSAPALVFAMVSSSRPASRACACATFCVLLQGTKSCPRAYAVIT